MQPCACAAPYEQSMSYGTFCINSAPNTGPQREKHNQTLVTGQLKYNWESVLSLNICDTGKKSHKKSESYNSKERTTCCERRQKQEAVAGLTEEHVTGCSCQARITSRQTWKEHNSPYSRLFNAKESLGKKRPIVPWDMNTEGFQYLSVLYLRQHRKPTAEPKAGSPELQPSILTTISFALEERGSSNQLNAWT